MHTFLETANKRIQGVQIYYIMLRLQIFINTDTFETVLHVRTEILPCRNYDTLLKKLQG